MFKVHFKAKSPFESWTSMGTYGTESQAIASAIQKKNKGAIMVRVTNSKGQLVYSN